MFAEGTGDRHLLDGTGNRPALALAGSQRGTLGQGECLSYSLPAAVGMGPVSFCQAVDLFDLSFHLLYRPDHAGEGGAPAVTIFRRLPNWTPGEICESGAESHSSKKNLKARSGMPTLEAEPRLVVGDYSWMRKSFET